MKLARYIFLFYTKRALRACGHTTVHKPSFVCFAFCLTQTVFKCKTNFSIKILVGNVITFQKFKYICMCIVTYLPPPVPCPSVSLSSPGTRYYWLPVCSSRDYLDIKYKRIYVHFPPFVITASICYALSYRVPYPLL